MTSAQHSEQYHLLDVQKRELTKRIQSLNTQCVISRVSYYSNNELVKLIAEKEEITSKMAYHIEEACRNNQ